ncbi:MAG: fatty acyl-AMP ligase [Pyrinomonadaceae bacterium]
MTEAITTLVRLLRDRAARTPERVAYTFLADGETGSGVLTYGELDRQARALGAKLQAMGAVRERVLLLYPSGLEFIAAFFGCLYAAAVAVPSYPPRYNRTIERLQAIVADTQAKIALTTTPLLDRLRSLWVHAGLEPILWVAIDEVGVGAEAEWREPPPDGAALAFLQYTSGSTSKPRGVMVSHANLLHNQMLLQQAVGATERSVFVSWLPFHHDMGLIGKVLLPLYAGAGCVLMPPMAFLQRPVRWLRAISRYRGTLSAAPNFAYDLCVRKVKEEQKATLDLGCWTAAVNGSEPVRARTLERFSAAFADCGFRREAFQPCYGLAEATLIVTGGRATCLGKSKKEPVENRAAESTSAFERELVSCGRVLGDQNLLIVDPESLIECPLGRIGEIWVTGSSVARGYWNCPEATRQTFHAYLADTGAGPYLRTGDLGFLDEGELFITGRLKDLIIIRGQNYYPNDIEWTVKQSHPALLPGFGAAFTIEEEDEERLIIAQEVSRDTKLDLDEVVGSIRQAVVECHGLQVYDVCLLKAGSIPRTTSGKIRRYACRNDFLMGALERIPHRPGEG